MVEKAANKPKIRDQFARAPVEKIAAKQIRQGIGEKLRKREMNSKII